jgi:hypothetical protein
MEMRGEVAREVGRRLAALHHEAWCPGVVDLA